MKQVRKAVVAYADRPGEFICDMIGCASLFAIVFGGLLTAVVVG